MSDQAIEEDVDLSAFPLLRIDQIHRHTTQTLIDAEAQLISDELELPFVQKLLSSVQHELTSRREGKQSLPPLQSTSSLVTVKRLANAANINKQEQSTRRAIVSSSSQSPTRRSIVSTSTAAATPIRSQQHQQPSFFVSNSPNNNAKSISNFRSRAKLAKASLQARSNEANLQELEQKRLDRTREALETIKDWRVEREKSKIRREDLLNEEREQRRQRWKERKEREARVRDEMQVAAEKAKSKALELGRTNDEAVVEAAAAAAKVVDDESIVFVDDESSFVDDGTCCTEDIDDNNTVLSQNVDDDVVRQGSTAVEVEAVISLSLLEESTKSTSGEEDEVDNQSCSSSAQHETTQHLDDDPSLVDREEESESSSSCSYDIEEDKDEENEETAQKDDSVCDEILSSQNTVMDEDTTSDQQQSTPSDNEVPSSSSTSSLSISQNQHLEQKTSISYEHKIPREETKPTKINKFCNIFSSFQDIFTNNSQRQKVSADVKQRDLSKSMQDQITQLTRARTLFIDIKCNRQDTSDSDSSLEQDEDDVEDTFDQGLFYRINSRRPEVASIIETAFSSAQLSAWKELPPDIDDSCWNLMWVWGLPKAADFDNLLVFQKINRFRNTRGLTRKDLLKKNIQQFSNKAKDGDSFNIMPLTYALPHEFNSFVSGYQSIEKVSIGNNKSSNIWIIKPVGLSRGRGISLVNDLSAVSYSLPIVIQRYIADPLCFKGFKLDLRIYVLVTSFNPLEAFIYKEGLARFGSRQYSVRPESLNDHRIHLTNSSLFASEDEVDRSHPAYLAGSNGAGNKVAFTWLWKRLEELGMDTKAMWNQMLDVCHKALVAAGSDIPHQPNSFEIFGFDLMFDQSLKCWLIEVNSSPSLCCDSSLDTRIKGSLIRDSIALVAPVAYDRKTLADVCKRRLTHRKSAATVSCKDVLESDLAKILKNRTPRQFGEKPRRLGNFERLVPD